MINCQSINKSISKKEENIIDWIWFSQVQGILFRLKFTYVLCIIYLYIYHLSTCHSSIYVSSIDCPSIHLFIIYYSQKTIVYMFAIWSNNIFLPKVFYLWTFFDLCLCVFDISRHRGFAFSSILYMYTHTCIYVQTNYFMWHLVYSCVPLFSKTYTGGWLVSLPEFSSCLYVNIHSNSKHLKSMLSFT